ncbi:MAG: phage terminase large subunit family protein [Helicobacteraceae bacterium]|jgi:phage terminase large subunit GpA-like protein|nr:phage terminase large subunit family protein [Helicobacteraceae bacterium]
MIRNEIVDKVALEILSIFKPKADITISEWADQNRVLSPEASAEAGKWRTDKAEYLRGIMDAFCDPKIHTIVVMSSSQVGKTEVINNVVGYHIEHDPAPILVVQPTVDPMAKAWSKDRLAPMLRDTPSLRGRVKEARSRDSGNTITHKSFAGGHISIVGANSPAGLASRPIRIVLCDEVDRYPNSAGAEGDPINLAFRRAETFFNRKCGIFSTPTIKGASRIEAAFDTSDQRRFFVPCPHCKTPQILTWSNVIWDKKTSADGKEVIENYPQTTRYYCKECGAAWDDKERIAAVKKGEWIAAKETTGIAGFWINALYSAWKPLSSRVEEFINAKKDGAESLKTFINTTLGESWEIGGDKADETELLKRVELYDTPDPIVLITAAIDTQDDRLELKIMGWADKEESYILDYVIIAGSPANDRVWQELDLQLDREWDGLRIARLFIDSGGHNADQVYKWAKRNEHKGFFAIKGNSDFNAPIIQRPKRLNTSKYKPLLWSLGVSTAKEQLLYRLLQIKEPSAGYIHFKKNLCDETYFKSLTSEKLVTKWAMGKATRRWELTKGARNEAWDLLVYNFAAMKSLNPSWEALKRYKENALIAAKKAAQDKEKPAPVKPLKRRASGFITAYK